ncbi:unnamed protein product [marine sediment metagenome]|uniref:Uncharacterized protein n=1 Tax=marine sediment metagenome TaxID=412755 RepID=X1HV06_9ZZZZ
MTGAKGVVFALTAAGIAGQAPILAERGKTLPSAGEQLVDIALVSHIPDNLIPRAIKYPM